MKQFRPRLTQKEYEIIQQHRSGSGVGIIGDTHEPFCHPDYRDFCYEVFDRFGVSDIVHIGDEVDNAALSYHEKLTDMPNAESVGNHSALPFRQATTAGIPKRFLKSYEEIWNAPKGWKWELNWEIDNVIYEHGTGSSGARAAVNRVDIVIPLEELIIWLLVMI